MRDSAKRLTGPPLVICVGEVIVDFVSTTSGVSLREAPAFMKAAGGAPANVSVGIARLGMRSGFVGKVGDDPFGHFLAGKLSAAGVDISGLRFDPQRKTRLAFVSLDRSGDRDFAFWENHPADEQLLRADLNLRKLARARVVHFSSFLLLKEPARSTVLRAARRLRSCGAIVSFDPNLRLSLWDSAANARNLMRRIVRCCTVLRLNDEEAEFLTGRGELDRAALMLLAGGPSLVVITRGAKGCFFRTSRSSGRVPGFRVRAVDTTGCGDAFLAALLFGIVRSGKRPEEIPEKELYEIARFANATGALTSLQYGAMTVPTSARVRQFLKDAG